MRVIGRVLLSAIFLILTALLMAAASFVPDLFFSFYTDISLKLTGWISSVTGLLPFALWEWLAVLVILVPIYFLVRKKKPIRWLTGLLLGCSVAVFSFVAIWGVNYYAPSVAGRLQLQEAEPTAQQLKQTALYMAGQAQAVEQQLTRDEQGVIMADFDRWASIAREGYDVLAQTDEFFHTDASVKKLLLSSVFSRLGFNGIYVPYTAEPCVNEETYPAALPFTMCHELAHSLSVAKEDEANFCAFLACIAHDDPAFRYSGWYSAFHYTYAALRQVDPAAAQEVAASVSASLWQDVLAADAQYAAHASALQETAQKANDLYLKAFGEDGTDSYDQVAKLLTAWYSANGE